MSAGTTAARRAWHPVTGAGLVAAPTLIAVLASLGPAVQAAAGLIAFLAMGAVAGFAVSGST